VSEFFFTEAKRVTAIEILDKQPDSESAYGWVEAGTAQTVIKLYAPYVKNTSLASLEETLAHELTHVTQSFDKTMADIDARQREAFTRGAFFRLKRDQETKGDWTRDEPRNVAWLR
jgi:hypothetical protein